VKGIQALLKKQGQRSFTDGRIKEALIIINYQPPKKK